MPYSRQHFDGYIYVYILSYNSPLRLSNLRQPTINTDELTNQTNQHIIQSLSAEAEFYKVRYLIATLSVPRIIFSTIIHFITARNRSASRSEQPKQTQ